MSSINQDARHDPAYRFDHNNYSLAYCEAVRASDVCLDVQAISSALVLFSKSQNWESRLHQDIVTAPDHVVTSHPLIYPLP